MSRRRLIATTWIGAVAVAGVLLVIGSYPMALLELMERARRTQAPCSGALPDDEAEVIRALLRDGPLKGAILTASDSFRSGGMLLDREGKSGVDERPETRRDFVRKSLDPKCVAGTSLAGGILVERDVPRRVRRLSGLARANAFYDWLRQRGVTALVSSSRVGFSADRQEAMVYADLWCGTLCASHDLYRLEWRNGRWTIAARRTYSIS